MMTSPDEMPVVLEELWSALRRAKKIVVKALPTRDAKILYESNEEKDRVELQQSLALEEPEEWFHCMCIGAPALYLYERGEQILELTNHHGYSVRCSLWSSDVAITDTERWLTWFDARGISGPRREVEAARAQHEQSNRDWDKWMAAMPKAIRRDYEAAIDRETGELDIARLRAALERDTTNERERILALLEWFGSGAGPWSGFLSYEATAEQLLLDFATIDIIEAIESIQLTPAQTEGAARLFGGWPFGKHRPNDLKLLSDELKGMLWRHTEGTSDKDKLYRAQRAFVDGGNS